MSSTTTELPFDLIIDTLCKLSVKDLLRLRSVSKSWRSFIDSPYFVNLHLNNDSNIPNLLFLISDKKLHFVDQASPHIIAEDLDLPFTFPFTSRQMKVLFIIGASNGLVAFHIRIYKTDFDSYGYFALWNPSIRERKVFKPPAPGKKTTIYTAFGFGYDAASDDYKIVSIHDARRVEEVLVYSLKSNAWRCIKEIPYKNLNIQFRDTRGIVCNGALHWMIKFLDRSSSENIALVAFNLEHEVFRDLPLLDGMMIDPKEPDRHEPLVFGMFSRCGSLPCVSRYHQYGNLVDVDIWEMKEYGVKESWVKIMSISKLDVWSFGLVCSESPLTSFGPMGKFWFKWSKIGDELESFCFPQVDRSEVHESNITWFQAIYYTRSLVSIKALRGKYIDRKVKAII